MRCWPQPANKHRLPNWWICWCPHCTVPMTHTKYGRRRAFSTAHRYLLSFLCRIYQPTISSSLLAVIAPGINHHRQSSIGRIYERHGIVYSHRVCRAYNHVHAVIVNGCIKHCRGQQFDHFSSSDRIFARLDRPSGPSKSTTYIIIIITQKTV